MQTHDSRPVSQNAMPSRRTFLKGALIAAATPATALAPLLPETLGGLVASFNENRRMLEAVEAQCDALWESPERPPSAFVRWDEMPAYFRCSARTDGYVSAEQINGFFDKELGITEFNTGIGMPETVRDRRTKEIETGRASVLALYEKREAAYKDWRASSGYEAVCDEMNRLSSIDENLDQKIVSYRCDTIDEARIKAAYVRRIYGEISSETAWTFVQSFLI